MIIDVFNKRPLLNKYLIEWQLVCLCFMDFQTGSLVKNIGKHCKYTI